MVARQATMAEIVFCWSRTCNYCTSCFKNGTERTRTATGCQNLMLLGNLLFAFPVQRQQQQPQQKQQQKQHQQVQAKQGKHRGSGCSHQSRSQNQNHCQCFWVSATAITHSLMLSHHGHARARCRPVVCCLLQQQVVFDPESCFAGQRNPS